MLRNEPRNIARQQIMAITAPTNPLHEFHDVAEW